MNDDDDVSACNVYYDCVCMQLFGYNASADLRSTDAGATSSNVIPSSSSSSSRESASVFAVNARRQVGEASGNKHRRDVVVQIRRVDELDCYLTATQRGIVSTWSNKVYLIASNILFITNTTVVIIIMNRQGTGLAPYVV